MSNHTGHGHTALAPWLSEREVELVVLNVRITINATLNRESTLAMPRKVERSLTTRTFWLPPARWCATDLAMAGFSATQRIFDTMSLNLEAYKPGRGLWQRSHVSHYSFQKLVFLISRAIIFAPMNNDINALFTSTMVLNRANARELSFPSKVLP